MGAGWIGHCNEAITGLVQLFPGGYNLLEWATTVESGLSGFWVERGVTGTDFEPVRFVPTQGTAASYRVRDEAPPAAPSLAVSPAHGRAG